VLRKQRDEGCHLAPREDSEPRFVDAWFRVIWRRGNGVKLHLRMDCLAALRGDVGPPNVVRGAARYPGWVEDAGIRGEARRDDRADVLREWVKALTDPVRGVDLVADREFLPAHVPTVARGGPRSVPLLL
jgi:hypothetical protein